MKRKISLDDTTRILHEAIGVNSVPFFVFNGTHSLSGAQPVDVFKKAINEYK